ncbi:MAG: 16S rRNA (adenine(1518)-N(6)/adenine(1519)-N(6))-dimethyltransferase RsmA [Vicinamibacterales bacterium]
MTRLPRRAADAPDRHRARRRFGQHFLQDVWSERVVKAIAPAPSDVFLEIGPGLGALTRPLLRASRHMVAFEIDRDLATSLRAADDPALTVVEGDVLEITSGQVAALLTERQLERAPLRVVGNLPYNIASPVLFKCIELYEQGLPVIDVIVMLQREVADRLLAPPGTGEYGVLSVLVRHVATVTRRLNLPPGAFRPIPEVHSTLVALRLHPPTPAPRDLALFRALTRAVFTRRRKTLANALLAWPAGLPEPPAALLARAGIDGRRRPETLDVPEFVRLADAVVEASRR